MAADDPMREGLPGRCDKPWFCKVFLSGRGLDRTGDDSIWDAIVSFNMSESANCHAFNMSYLRLCFAERLCLDAGTTRLLSSRQYPNCANGSSSRLSTPSTV